MNPLGFLVMAAALLPLSGCFTSKTDLVGSDAVADHAVITFLGEEDDAKPVTFTREGTHYVTRGDGQEVSLHLKPVGDDYYVAQLGGPGDDGGTEYLFGYMRLDVGAGLAEVWLMVGGDADVRPGLSEGDDVICIDDLAAYVAYGQEKVAAGEASDADFKVTVE
jgi:hypothetical protein